MRLELWRCWKTEGKNKMCSKKLFFEHLCKFICHGASKFNVEWKISIFKQFNVLQYKMHDERKYCESMNQTRFHLILCTRLSFYLKLWKYRNILRIKSRILKMNTIKLKIINRQILSFHSKNFKAIIFFIDICNSNSSKKY